MHMESNRKAAKKPTARSRVTNGSKLGTDMDGRTVWARRLRDLIDLYSADVGDPETIANSTRSLIRRAAVLTVELERAEKGFAEKGEADPTALSAYQTTSNSLRRLLESLNIKATVKQASDVARVIEGGRVVKDITENMTVQDLGACVGTDRAKRDVARRIAFAVENSRRTGEPIPQEIAEFAVKLCLAEYADATDEESIL